MVTTPLAATLSFHASGPKSGFQPGLPSFFGSASYSPARTSARLLRSGTCAAWS